MLRWRIATSSRLVRMTCTASLSAFAGFRFPREVIKVAVRWYLRYGLSYRGLEAVFAEHGITIDPSPSTDGSSGSLPSSSTPLSLPLPAGRQVVRRRDICEDPAGQSNFAAATPKSGADLIELDHVV